MFSIAVNSLIKTGHDLHKLNDINDEYDAVGKSDCRLTEDRDGGRRCGGIGILWHKSIAASPIPGIGSDRICGIRFSMVDGDNSAVSEYTYGQSQCSDRATIFIWIYQSVQVWQTRGQTATGHLHTFVRFLLCLGLA